ncbi:MAG: DUF2183 domain-containing protein [Propionibacteriaceae bacterium]|jgi:phosphatidate phosphatase APP1|nr:DUF2183 domain-containing protein [Propionibacteriaceae bacterium]
MRNRPFIAARVEKRVNRWTERLFRSLRWHDAIIAYTGYGNEHRMRVLARVVIYPRGARALNPAREQVWTRRRGWRNLYRQPAVNRAVEIHVGDTVTHALTTRDGYVDIAVSDHGLAPGWHHVTITTADSEPTLVPILIISDQTRFGIISDIDDTIITSFLPRPLIAVYNALIPTESARVPVVGMAAMYRTLLREHPGAPLIYVSTGAWNTQPFLERFVARHGFPPGPMILSDWGPTNTGWFRSGPSHKMRALESLVRDFPSIRWLLVGDDGQRDPWLYTQFSRRHPDNVAAIAIRQLPIMEQVLAHGTTGELEDSSSPRSLAPEVRAPDGHVLLPLVAEKLKGLD